MARESKLEGQARSSRIGLALAGGGPQGAIYEIGALRALDEVLEGVDFNDLYVYVGVSAGAFIAANLANDLTTAQMCRAIVKQEPGEHPFVSETFFVPASRELLRRGATVPKLLLEALWRYAQNPRDHSLLDSLTSLTRALPVGVFNNDRLREYLEKIYTIKGRTDDFRQLGKHLVVVAADLDSGEAVRFGEPGFDQVPISVAVQASSALPGLYPPVEIDGRHYVDGVLLKTIHGSVALEAGAKLLICLNPLVPVDTSKAVAEGVMRRGKLIDRGLPTVLSQSLRTLIRSRLEAGLSSYEKSFPDSDVVLFEPRRDDYEMFFNNVFSFSSRRTICEHAYLTTRRQLRERQEELAPIFARHGIRLRTDLLVDDGAADLWCGVGLQRKPADRTVLGDLERVLGRLEGILETGP
ncbi:MAG: patatin-like phospholipase family protein [Thermoanaerobaculia bacterium]